MRSGHNLKKYKKKCGKCGIIFTCSPNLSKYNCFLIIKGKTKLETNCKCPKCFGTFCIGYCNKAYLEKEEDDKWIQNREI